MKSNVIKYVVVSAKRVLNSQDRKLESQTNQQLISDISRHLNAEFDNSPRTVSAIIKYIEDRGFELRRMDCVHTRTCIERAEATLKKIDPNSLKSIENICNSMFAQYTGKHS